MSDVGARKILIATGNPAKFREMAEVLRSCEALAHGDGSPIEWLSLSDLPVRPGEPVEDGATFADNARLKAVYYSRLAGCWAIADDSGLEVFALGGDPGIHSARYAGLNHTADRRAADTANNKKLIEKLRSVPEERRGARFRCAVALADGARVLLEAEGEVAGRIIDTPRGSGGFGYDPHFFVDELGCTTAELPPEEKHRVSHRGRALRALARQLGELLRRDAGDEL